MPLRPPDDFFRFLAAGALNTGLTYLLYLLLIRLVSYRIGYSLAFVGGIGLSYLLNRFFVFRAGGGLRAVVMFPLVYLGQYLAGLAVVSLWVEWCGWPAALAPLAAVAVTVPLTYLLSRPLFGHPLFGRREQQGRH